MRPASALAVLAVAALGLLVAAGPVQAQAVGSEFQVNTFTTSAQRYPSAAMDSVGNFVVVWKSYHAAGYPIEGQRFGADGSHRGGEFQVSTTAYTYYPDAGMVATGN